jgi:arabinan endo-1,5-alpha-L-arabinosidase
MKRSLLLLAVAFAAHCASAGAYPNPGRVVGGTLIHDPSMVVRDIANPACTCLGDPRYLVYGTNNLMLGSADRITFPYLGQYFPAAAAVKPKWWGPYAQGPWAPDVSFHGGRYWMYYAMTAAVGSHQSGIGLATSPSGLPGTWTDYPGNPIVTSTSNDDFNAIDPNLLVDSQGRWWLTYGSFWSGIWQVSLDPQTGTPTGSPAVHLAERPRTAGQPGPGIEGPFVYEHGGAYYLFVSIDRCCNGLASTYKIAVGKSSTPNGHYFAADGTTDMLNGGSTVILAGHDDVIGPGGQSVVHDDYFGSHDLLVYHYYDRTLNTVNSASGKSPIKSVGSLGINFLDFTRGFPRFL